MVKYWAISVLLALAALSTARADCDDLDNVLNVPSPLTEDTTIYLDVETIECLPLREEDVEVEVIVVDGGYTLTITSDTTVEFINVAFTVMPGAALVFNVAETKFGPNSVSVEDSPSGNILRVYEDATLTFNGDFIARGISNVSGMIRNDGTMEFKSTALFDDNINALWMNTGTVKFRDYAAFTGNSGVAVSASESGFVRFSGDVLLDDNGQGLDGTAGCAVEATDLTSRIIFRGQVSVINNNCRRAEGQPVYNRGTMKFYGKARFNDNTGGFNGGGAVINVDGSMTFRKAVQFNNNESEGYGGGLAVEGGDVTFRKAVLFEGNTAASGGAFAVSCGQRFSQSDDNLPTECGTLTFKKPSVVRIGTNTVDLLDEYREDDNCTIGSIEDEGTVIGFPGEDICVAASA